MLVSSAATWPAQVGILPGRLRIRATNFHKRALLEEFTKSFAQLFKFLFYFFLVELFLYSVAVNNYIYIVIYDLSKCGCFLYNIMVYIFLKHELCLLNGMPSLLFVLPGEWTLKLLDVTPCSNPDIISVHCFRIKIELVWCIGTSRFVYIRAYSVFEQICN